MAEIVEYRVEKTIDELRQLKQIGVFTKAEVKDILSKRQNFEYGLRKRTKNKLDYLKYIQYEINLLNSVKEFKDKLIVEQKEMKRNEDPSEDEIERKLYKLKIKLTTKVMRSTSLHISNLFRQLTIRYQFDRELWLAYIEFVKSLNWHERVSSLYWRTLRVHNTDEHLWIEAAKYEYDTRKAFDISRKLFLRSVRHHPASILIWSEYVAMELNYLDFLIQRRNVITASEKPLIFKLQNEEDNVDSMDDADEAEDADFNHSNKEDEVAQLEESQESILGGKLIMLVVDQACNSLNSSAAQQQFLNNVKVKLSLFNQPEFGPINDVIATRLSSTSGLRSY